MGLKAEVKIPVPAVAAIRRGAQDAESSISALPSGAAVCGRAPCIAVVSFEADGFPMPAPKGFWGSAGYRCRDASGAAFAGEGGPPQNRRRR